MFACKLPHDMALFLLTLSSHQPIPTRQEFLCYLFWVHAMVRMSPPQFHLLVSSYSKRNPGKLTDSSLRNLSNITLLDVMTGSGSSLPQYRPISLESAMIKKTIIEKCRTGCLSLLIFLANGMMCQPQQSLPEWPQNGSNWKYVYDGFSSYSHNSVSPLLTKWVRWWKCKLPIEEKLTQPAQLKECSDRTNERWFHLHNQNVISWYTEVKRKALFQK